MSDRGAALARVEAVAPGHTRRHHPLSSYAAYKVGGAAELLVEPETPDELGAALKVIHEEHLPLFVLGGGTNLLIRDGGISGVVIRMGKSFRGVEVTGESIVAGAIAPMSKVARAAEEASLEGLEFGFDIPGTVGGALRMNAGAHGGEIQNVLTEARGFDHRGTFWEVPVSDVRFAYRTAVYPIELIFTEAVFKPVSGDREVLAERRRKNHEYRLRTQPKGNTVGSVFKNPEGDHAGRLVEAAGLKGFRFGGAVVSEKHANWILNDRQGTAHDIESLIRTIQEKVREQFGIELEPEVRIVGDALPAGEEVS
jgi:UDP-N-acetylmuramate dehydrogenase